MANYLIRAVREMDDDELEALIAHLTAVRIRARPTMAGTQNFSATTSATWTLAVRRAAPRSVLAACDYRSSSTVAGVRGGPKSVTRSRRGRRTRARRAPRCPASGAGSVRSR
jgi:hypothetical protein